MGKHSILIVDDEPGMLDSLSILLEEDFNILTASNGKGGLSVFEDNPSISMILLDMDMPVMNGLEMLIRIRETSDIKVVIMTGRSTHEWAMKCADLNVQGYIEKPLKIEAMIKKIKKLLGVNDYKILREVLGKEYEEQMISMSHIVKNTLQYIEKESHTNFNIKQISTHLDVTHEHLSRLFYKDCNIHLKEYINRFKIDNGKKYLAKKPCLNIRDIAESVGISNESHFCKLFKQYTNVTPTQFRKNLADS